MNESLDVAWAEAEAALPEGWRILALNYWFNRRDWVAQARRPDKHPDGSEYVPELSLAVGGVGATPSAALHDLAARLRETTVVPHG